MAQDPALTYLRHGQSNFFRLPVSIGDPPPGTKAVLMGVQARELVVLRRLKQRL